MLAPRIEGAGFLDLYAGSGAVGLEALSRGAAHVRFVERAPAALKVLRKNLEQLGIKDRYEVRAESVSAFLRSAAKANPGPYEVLFADPPYDDLEEYATTLGTLGRMQEILVPGAIVIAEHRRKQKLDEQYGALRRKRLLEQGDAALSFYGLEAEISG